MTVESPPRTCPRCEAPVATDARFCANCGQALGEPDVDSGRQARLIAAAPAPLIEKMRAARLTGERKPVTALFVDVVGSTSLAETMDPEDWTVMINEAFDLMSKAVFRYEGTIAQLQGDAMLAFFGAPVAHEDDPERAIRAALDMIADTAEFSRELKSVRGIDFRIRAGINSGPVMVGNVGSDLRYEYTALGDAMNVAARMEAAAEPGQVLITANTYRFVRDAFDVDDLGDIAVKGKAEPVHAYRVIGLKAVRGRRRGLESVGLSSPLVGRSQELEALRSVFSVVAAGRGRVAVVVGEPGIGKSRLLSEFKTAIGDAGATWIEGHCVSYGRGLPYHLALDLVRAMFAIPFAASEADARAKLHDGLRTLPGDEAVDVEPYLAHLLGLPLSADDEAHVNLDPEWLQGRYVASMHRVVRTLAAKSPLVLVLEDIHWADPASVEVMLGLLPLVTQQPVLVLAAGRGETDAPGWKIVTQARSVFGDALTELRLQPLSDGESRTLVANLLEIESLPERVRDAILKRSEGNPFFVEEVIRMLIERGAIAQHGDRWIANETISSVEIPETLHGLLLARIDQLPDGAKRSLRVASVIGRQFPVRVLENVLESAEASA
jgi:class 3 adenylate cyclase